MSSKDLNAIPIKTSVCFFCEKKNPQTDSESYMRRQNYWNSQKTSEKK